MISSAKDRVRCMHEYLSCLTFAHIVVHCSTITYGFHQIKRETLLPMSANTPSTSAAPKTALQGASRVFVLTPDMLKKLGLTDQLKQIQSKIKPENTVQLVADSKRSSAAPKPKLIIPSDKVRIVSKKKTLDNENKKVKSSVKPSEPVQENQIIDKIGVNKEKLKTKLIEVPTNLRKYPENVKEQQKIVSENQRGAAVTENSSKGGEFIRGDENHEASDNKLVTETVEIVELMISERNNASMNCNSLQEDQLLERIDSKNSQIVTPMDDKSQKVDGGLLNESLAITKNSKKSIRTGNTEENYKFVEIEDMKSTESSTESFRISRAPVKAPMNELITKIPFDKSPISAAKTQIFPESSVLQNKNTEDRGNDDLVHLQDTKSANKSPKKVQDSLKSTQIQQIRTEEEPSEVKVTNSPESLSRLANTRSFKPKGKIIRTLTRGVQKDNKTPATIPVQNDNQLLSSPLLSINPEPFSTKLDTAPGKLANSPVKLITNLKTSEKFQDPTDPQNDLNPPKSPGKDFSAGTKQRFDDQISNNESSTPKPLNNLDVLMAAVDINLKHENSRTNNALPLPKIISLTEIPRPVTHSTNDEPGKNPEIFISPVKTTEKAKVIDNNDPNKFSNPKLKRKRASKIDVGYLKAQKIPRKSLQENSKSIKTEENTPLVTPSPTRTSRRQAKPKIFEDCIMGPSKHRKNLENQTDAIVNLLSSRPTPRKQKSFSSSTKGDSPKKLIIDESRSESSNVEGKDSKQVDEKQTIVEGVKLSGSTEKHNEEIRQSVADERPSMMLNDLAPISEGSVAGGSEEGIREEDVSCHLAESNREAEMNELSERPMPPEKSEIKVSEILVSAQTRHELGENINDLDFTEKPSERLVKSYTSVAVDDSEVVVSSVASKSLKKSQKKAMKKLKGVALEISKLGTSLKGEGKGSEGENIEEISSREITTILLESSSKTGALDEEKIVGAGMVEVASESSSISREKSHSIKIVRAKSGIKPLRRISQASKQTASNTDSVTKNVKPKAKISSRKKSHGSNGENDKKEINSEEITTVLLESSSKTGVRGGEKKVGAGMVDVTSESSSTTREKINSMKIIGAKPGIKPLRRISRASKQAPDTDVTKNVEPKAKSSSRRKSQGSKVSNEEKVDGRKVEEISTGGDQPHGCKPEENPVETPPVIFDETIPNKDQPEIDNFLEVPALQVSAEIHKRPEESIHKRKTENISSLDLIVSPGAPTSGPGDPAPLRTSDSPVLEPHHLSPVPEESPKRQGRQKRPPSLEQQPDVPASEEPPQISPNLPKRRGRKKKAELEKLLPPPVVPLPSSEPPQDPGDLLRDPETRQRKALTRPDETDGEGLSESDQEPSFPPPPQSRRGRGRRKPGRGRGRSSLPVDPEYTPRVISATKYTDTPTPPSPTPSKPQPATTKCGKCQEEIASTSWARHNLMKHNNMGWKSTDPEPDFSDLKALTRLLFQTKKKKPSLTCESCATVKKSVAGFISHITFCGKTEVEKQSLMWTCPICRVILMPSSQEYHERVHRDQGIVPSKKKKKKKEIVKETVDLDTSRVKRKAAERAATRISEFTELVKASDDPPAKKKKLGARIKEFIDQPIPVKTIPSVWKAMWARAINHNEKAYCREPHCDFSSPTLRGICEHYSTCNFIPRTMFVCKICQWSCEKNSEIVGHVKDVHSSEVNVDDSDYNGSEGSEEEEEEEEEEEDDDEEMDEEEMIGEDGETKRRRGPAPRARARPKAKFLGNYIHIRNYASTTTFGPALKWTVEFQTEYYGLRLFEELEVNGFEMVDDPEEYLPKLKVSMPTSVLRLKDEEVREEDWRRWDRFGADVVDSVPMFFTGGPVWGLAWMPIPATMHNKKPEQFVAISTHKGMEDYFEVGRSYCGKNCIQIWNLGALGNDSTYPSTPELCYAVGHEGGTIWCLEWCPSGGYEEGGKRMGLLAAAMSSGLVHIYSMPFPEVVGSGGKLFKTDPVMVLHISDEAATASQCMTLCWSKTSNHDTLAAGFANGYVALWNLSTKSPLLRTKQSSTIHLHPLMHFYAHGHAVMFVTIVPLEEKRYLVTAGMDRCSKMWDLEDTSLPFWLLKKGVAVNGTWMTHWPTILTSYDDVLGLAHTQTYLAPIREAATRVLPILPTNSPVYAIASSDWANGICQGTGAGEIVAIFPPQMLYPKEIDKISRTRWLVSNVKVVDFEKKEAGKEYEYKPAKYEECQERFGVAFCDDLDNTRGVAWMSQHDRKGFLSTDTMQQVPMEQYPIAAINRISWNSNGWSYLWIAVGYRNGLIRVLNLKRMNKNSITGDMLSKHAAAMRKKQEEVISS